MKVSFNWIREFIDLSSSPQEVGNALTLHTCELEDILAVSDSFNSCVTGKIIDISNHAASEKLKKATVDTGTHGIRSILFGQTLPLEKNTIVFVALPGAHLPNGMEIAEREMAGELSQGMICVGTELGYKTESLFVFPPNTPIGIPVKEACAEFNDILFDIDNKSLTHRPDMWGVYGFVRELSALFSIPKKALFLSEDAIDLNTSKPAFPIEIKTDHCKRFMAVRVSGVQNGISSLQEQIRLENLGVRSISSLVDITNHVLLEYGQPMHVFDASRIEGKIIVRNAQKGETLLALDGETYTLEPSDIVIADEKKVLSIAGIMGGLESSVTTTTTDVVFESANFDPVSIRKTSSRLGLRSESSLRFEKTLDPENCKEGLLKALSLLQEQNPHMVLESSIGDNYPSPYPQKTLLLHMDRVRMISGIDDLNNTDIVRFLESVDFIVTLKKDHIAEVQVPSFRATKDICGEEDLIEEVVRLYGLDKIPAKSPRLPVVPPEAYPLRDLEWKIRDYWSTSGFLEVMNYSFANEKDKEFAEKETTEVVAIKNPLSSQQSFLRVNLVSNILKNLESDLRTHKNLSYFEIGKVFSKNDQIQGYASSLQKNHAAFLRATMGGNETDLFFELQSEIQSFGLSCGLSFVFQPSENILPYAHPAKTADILYDGIRIGQLFVLHPAKNSIRNASLVFAEIDLSVLLSQVLAHKTVYKHLSPYPVVLRDISLLMPKKTLMIDIVSAIKEASSSLQSVELFDEFEDENLFGSGQKNLAFHLVFGSSQKVLSEQDIEKDFQNIVRVLSENFQASLRI